MWLGLLLSSHPTWMHRKQEMLPEPVTPMTGQQSEPGVDIDIAVAASVGKQWQKPNPPLSR